MTDWMAAIAWGLVSVVWVEVVHDVYHALAHVWTPLYKLHVWHHRVFRPDLTPASQAIYCKAQWRNDLPESLVMLAFSLLLWGGVLAIAPRFHWFALTGSAYSLSFLGGAIARGSGWNWAQELTDLTHRPGAFATPPSNWFVNRTYHWRHHFDNQNAYYCGALTLVDKLMGTALSLKGKRVAVTGASGALGRSLLKQLYLAGAIPIALTSKTDPLAIELDGETVSVETVTWTVGKEAQLAELFERVDILLLNHGVNVQTDRTPEAMTKSYEVNAFSGLRMMEQFLQTVRTNEDIARKEVWVNTSEAEVSPAVSPLYELSKRTMGDLVTLRRLDAPCTIRKIILGPFKSHLNPIGIMSPNWVAKQIVRSAKSDTRNMVITFYPWTYLLFPIKEWFVSSYFKLFSRKAILAPNSVEEPPPSTVKAKSR